MKELKQIRNSDVTVVIPCYNDGSYIEEALHSILDQTLLPRRIIIVDDGSSQMTREVLKELNHELLFIIYQENKGVSVARNNGIKAAETEYILTLDADDYFEDTFLEKAYQYLEAHKDVGVVGCYYRLFGLKIRNEEIVKPEGGTIENFLVRNNGLGCSLFRKKCWTEVSGYDESFKNGYEDWDFWIAILSRGWRMYIIQEPLFNYRKKYTSRDSIATSKYDYDLRVALFEKYRDLYKSYFDSYIYQSIWRGTTLKSQAKNRENSMDYKLGKFLLDPIRKVKRFFTN